MMTVGDTFPKFNLKAVRSTEMHFEDLTEKSFSGKWKLYMFWPKDFTFVCPTEIIAFNDMLKQFKERDCEVIGASCDTDFVHLAWRRSREDLAKVAYPWLADNQRELTGALGVLDKKEGVALRATFLVDPDGIIRFSSVNDLSVGRNPQEVLRVLDALQTDELCPCNWKPGQDTIKVA